MVAVSDYFVPGSPSNALFVSSILPRSAQWKTLSLYFSFGCALGAFLLASFMAYYGDSFVAWVMQSEAAGLWQRIDEVVSRHGFLALAVLAVTAAPVRIAVAVLALAGYMPVVIAAVVLAGRLIAYPTLAWMVSRFPDLAGRIPLLGALLRRAKASMP